MSSQNDFKPLLSPALKIKKAQGHHGMKGATIGKECGKLSLSSPKYKNYQQRLKQGLVDDKSKPGRRPSKDKGKKKRDNNSDLCMKRLTFRKQLELIDVYRRLQQELGDSVPPKVAAMREYFGKDRFDADYPTKENKKKAKRRLQQILDDEIRLKYAVLSGFGDRQKWTKGGIPNNPIEGDIAKQLDVLSRNGIKITARIITNVALRLSASAGIKCQWTDDCNDLLSILDKEEIEENMKIINESQENSDDKYGKDVFSPSQQWRSRFMKRYNFGHGNEAGTQTNFIELMTQMEPALTVTYCLRMLYDIKGGEGRIKNADQSMFYRYYETKKSWHKQ